MATGRLSLAQQIAQLEDAAPADFDLEDMHVAVQEQEDTGIVDSAAAREHYVDVGPSSLRMLRDSVADPKYDGVRTSRKQLMEDSEDEGSDEDEEVQDSAGKHDSADGRDMADEHSEHGGEPDAAPSESDEEAEEEAEAEPQAPQPIPDKSPPSRQVDPGPTDDLSSTLRQKREEDRKKGKAVSQQIALWDNLLDARIRLQKTVTSANRLPMPSDLPEYLKECQESLNEMLGEAMLLSEELFELQEDLLISNETLTPPPRKRRKVESTDDALVDYAAHFKSATQSAAALEKSFHPYLIQTLSKWSSKIQAVAPSVLLPSNRNAFSAKHSQSLKSVIQLIDETLTDREKMIARTQVRRGNSTRIGAAEPAAAEDATGEIDPEAFDDVDFYQQLLRDVIDSKGNSAGGADDWMTAQKARKAKKKVDTKASKGRKLRYEVHEKLQNFMVPVPVVGGWHDEQIDELFASLLGRGFKSTDTVIQEEVVDGRLEEELQNSLQSGFRVFG